MTPYIHCNRCTYNSTIPGIVFDENTGICNYCQTHDELCKQYPTGERGLSELKKIVNTIKENSKNKKYDCIVGVSGGCDSSYLLVKAKEFGLRPLAVHFDNTYNSKIATENIYNLVSKLDVDLETYVVNNKEFDDIILSFLKSSAADFDAPTDIAFTKVLYQTAEKYNVKYIFDGHSFRTEGIAPLDWSYMDGKYVKSVHRKYGTMKMKTFPNLSILSFIYSLAFKRIKRIRPLYYLDYNKEAAKKFLSDSYEWQWYGGHHLENKTANFSHTYFLPKKSNKDLRQLGHAALVRSGQMTREAAFASLQQPIICDPSVIDLIKKRLNLSSVDFDKLISQPEKKWTEFPNYKKTFEILRPLFFIMVKMDLLPKSIYIKFCINNQTEIQKNVANFNQSTDKEVETTNVTAKNNSMLATIKRYFN